MQDSRWLLGKCLWALRRTRDSLSVCDLLPTKVAYLYFFFSVAEEFLFLLFWLLRNNYIIRFISFSLASEPMFYSMSFSAYFSGSPVTPTHVLTLISRGRGASPLSWFALCLSSECGRWARRPWGCRLRWGPGFMMRILPLTCLLSFFFFGSHICSLCFMMLSGWPQVSEILIHVINCQFGWGRFSNIVLSAV